jgi:hypothetical protein
MALGKKDEHLIIYANFMGEDKGQGTSMTEIKRSPGRPRTLPVNHQYTVRLFADQHSWLMGQEKGDRVFLVNEAIEEYVKTRGGYWNE